MSLITDNVAITNGADNITLNDDHKSQMNESIHYQTFCFSLVNVSARFEYKHGDNEGGIIKRDNILLNYS